MKTRLFLDPGLTSFVGTIGLVSFPKVRITRFITVLATFAVLTLSCRASIIAQWSFNSAADTDVDNQALAPDSSSFANSVSLTPHAGGNKVTASTTGAELKYLGDGTGGGSSQLNVSTFVIALTPTTSLSQFSITYVVKNTAGGPTSITWSRTGGSGTVTITVSPNQTTTPISTTFTSYTATFSGLTAGSGVPLTFTADFDGASANNGSILFDSVQVDAVPEPANAALALFGLGFAGIAVGRRVYKRIRK